MEKNFFPHSRTVRLDIIKVVYLPTDTQENCFKKNIKIYIKTAPTCFRYFVRSLSFRASNIHKFFGDWFFLPSFPFDLKTKRYPVFQIFSEGNEMSTALFMSFANI